MLEQAASIGLQPVAERDSATGGPLLDDDESVLHKYERLQLVIGASTDQGEGTLFITEWRIFWLSSAEATLGYSVDFTSISMHAVATDEESGNRPCLYIQLDSGDLEEGMGGGDEDDEEEEAADEPLPELRLIPVDGSQLEALFQAFCEGAERNPDHSDEEGEEDAEGGVFFDEDEVLAGAAGAALGVGDVEELVGEDPDRFDDADADAQAAAPAGQAPGGSGGAPRPNGTS